ncbi:hypothetical protein HUJ04_001872 [Dendroctonus ponderosae]|nr:hypothetical protein HUJ04_001872 [Dendroctonus ponderosae]
MNKSKLNCEVLDDELAFEVRWAVAGESIVLQMVAKLEEREYMSFGLSGEVANSVMIGGDVVVAWVDKETLKGYAYDYYLGDKSQCSGPTGSCPDSKLAENSNNIRLLNAAMVNGYSIVTFQRPLKASDQFDLPILTNQSQAIIWAVGPLNQRDEVSFHSSYLKQDSFIDFARPAKWNCPLPEGETAAKHVEPLKAVTTEAVAVVASTTTSAPTRREGGNRRRGSNRISTRQPETHAEIAEEGQASKRESTRTRGTSNKISQRGTQTVPPPTPVKERNAWYIPPIECYEPEDGVFYAQMGPTGGKRGYPAITGHVGWGISWYINGLLIPEINVVRGKTYNFITEGGDNPEVSAKYHPFYITDDPVGGYAYKTPEERKNISILAGVRFDKAGEPIPVGVGRLCHWTHSGDSDADDFDSFGAYQRTLQLKCDVGEPGIVTWTPDRNTPDTVYYQCFTHRHLGWKINVHDSCEQAVAASELQPTIVKPSEAQSDLEPEASIRQESVVMPNEILVAPHNRIQPAISELSITTLDPSPTPTGHQQLLTQKQHPLIIRPDNDFKHAQTRLSVLNLTTPTRLKQMPNIQRSYLIYKRPVDKQQTLHTTNTYAILPKAPKNVQVKNVDISPMQASTERDPEIQTAEAPFEMSASLEGTDHFGASTHRGTKQESGFDDQRFVPQVNPERGDHTFLGLRHSRRKLSIRSTGKSDREQEMAASEHVESFYLPPPGASKIPSNPAGKMPSEIDFEAPAPPTKNNSSKLDSPPHVVVTFDGKRVSGASLTAKPFEKSMLERGSKAAELLKTHPQSVPFQGDLPPLNVNVLFHSPETHPGVLSRDLDTPLPQSGSTKLKRVRRII